MCIFETFLMFPPIAKNILITWGACAGPFEKGEAAKHLSCQCGESHEMNCSEWFEPILEPYLRLCPIKLFAGVNQFWMIFSLKNIDDAGFGLRNSSKLGNLLHRKWPDGHNEAELVVNVWGSCGHVFVATNNGRNLHAFETIPRSKWRPESEGLLLQGMNERLNFVPRCIGVACMHACV